MTFYFNIRPLLPYFEALGSAVLITIAIAIVQSTSFAFLFHNGGIVGGDLDLLPKFNAWTVFVVVLTLTSGTALLMWMGELITQRGIGNGMSLLIFTSVVSSLPAQGALVQSVNGTIALIALTVGSVFGDRGILNLVNKRRQVEALRDELDGLRAENARLSSEIAALRTSPRAIERLAREQLVLPRPDETVFLIREEDGSAPR